MMNFDRDKRGSYDEDAPKKTPIVTKKMLADSGHDNLRDYLNAQRGLTRRKPKAAPKDEPATLKDEPAAPKVGASSRGPITEAMFGEGRASAPPMPKGRRASGPITEAMFGEGRASAPPMPKGRRASGPVTEYEDEKPKAFAKGGSVSGRADGIAKKGKTNCKMV